MAYTRKDDHLMQGFGRRLRASRIAAGYEDAATLAKDLGVLDQAYRKYERGESMPPPAVLQMICNLLDKTLDFLVFGTSDRAKPRGGE